MEVSRRRAPDAASAIDHDPLPARAETPRPPALQRGARAIIAARDKAAAAARKFPTRSVESSAPADRRSAVQREMDRFMRDATAPYRVDGKEVRVSPAFRMNAGWGPNSEKALDRLKRELPKELVRSLGGRLTAIAMGKGNPEEIRRVTQALIDAGQLAKYPAPSIAASIRKLQFDHGIGNDCSGFTYQSTLFAAGRGRNVGLNEGIPFPTVSIDPLKARPGDLIVLKGLKDTEPGHKVAVYAHETLPAGARAPNFQGKPPVDPSFMEGGPVHVFQVDSSWGGGEHGDYGGVGREVWLYNESSKKWAYFNQHDGDKFTVSRHSAYDHEMVGVFGARP